MQRKYIFLLVICILLVCSISSFGKQFVSIATAPLGGSYYPAGTSLAQLLDENLGEQFDIKFSAMSSAGSVENADLLRKKEAQIATMQNNVVLWAYEGSERYEGIPYKDFRILSPLFDSVYHTLVSENINDLQEIHNKKWAVGRVGSGIETSNKLMLEALGMHYDSYFKPEFLGVSEAAEALRNGLVSGTMIPAGIPIASVSDLMASPVRRYNFYHLSDEEISKIRSAEPWMMPMVIPANSYLHQPEEILTLGHSSYIVGTVDMSEELAYQIVKTLFENLDWLVESYSGWNELTLDNVSEGFLNFTVPIHEGALRYYREMGIAK